MYIQFILQRQLYATGEKSNKFAKLCLFWGY